MPEDRSTGRTSVVAKLAHVSYMFLMMNYSAVAGTLSAILRRKMLR